MHRRPLLASVACFVLALPAGQAQQMFFTGNGNGADTVRRADLDGQNVQVLVSGLPSPQSIAVDSVHGKLYWTDSGVVQRSDLDGQNVQAVVTGLVLPRGIAVDPAGGKIYFAHLAPARIQRANLDGSNVQDLVTAGLNAPTAVALDLVAGKVYWTDVNNDVIQRANLDGTNVETVLNEDGWGIAVDPAGGRLYWSTTQAIRRANLDGSNAQTIVPGLSWGRAVAVDAAGGKVYWSDGTANRIQRADLDGQNVEDLITTGLDTILGIALDLPACPLATVASYGQGFPGTFGTPNLSALAPPQIGAVLNLHLGNSVGAPTNGLLIVGVAPLALPGFWGGDLLVAPLLVIVLPAIPAAGLPLAGAIPPNPSFCGLHVLLQALEADAGAAAGASSTAGLMLGIGS